MAVNHLPRCVDPEVRSTSCGGPRDRHGPFTLAGCQPFAPNDAWLVHGGVDRMGSLRGAIRVRTARLRTIHHCPRLASPAIFAARRAATGGPSSDLGGDNSGRDRLLVSGHLGRNPHYWFHNNRRGAAPEFYGSVVLWLENHGVVLAELWAEHINGARLVRLAQEITTRLSTVASFFIVVFIYVLLGLLEVDEVSQKLRTKRLSTLGPMLLAGGAQTAVKLRQYMIVRSLMSVMTGLLVWAFARLSGSPCIRMGRLGFRLELHPVHRPIHRNCVPDAVCHGPIRIHADRRPDLRLPEHYSVRRWQLHRAEISRPLFVYLSFCRSVRRILLDVPLGSTRRLRPDRDRDH